jgi:polysaccharide export outer membrane protein
MSRIFVLLLGCWAAAAQVRIQPTPDATIANLPAQRIGANDLIAVSVYDAPELTRTVRVGADGLIRLPMLRRRIQAQGFLPADLEVAIAEALQAEQLIVEPVVTVTVVEYHSRPISVAGAVKNPITFQAVGPVTLLDAVTRAGGLSQEAGPEILVSRAQPGEGGNPTFLIQRIPIKGLIDQADPELNLRLAGGEEIRVPEAGKVFVVGNVKKPGAYAIREGAETSVLRVLAVAEGLTPYSAKQAFIYRREEGSTVRHEIPIELKKIMQRQAPDVPLQANDIFYIPDNSGRRAGLTALERIAGFGAATTSGILIYRR